MRRAGGKIPLRRTQMYVSKEFSRSPSSSPILKQFHVRPHRMSTLNQSFATQHPKISVRAIQTLFRDHVSWINVATFVGLLMLCIVYIVQVNGSISKGYQIRNLETQIQELSIKNQALELNTQRVQSLDHVVRSVKMLGLVDAERPEYINVSAPTYAFAN